MDNTQTIELSFVNATTLTEVLKKYDILEIKGNIIVVRPKQTITEIHPITGLPILNES